MNGHATVRRVIALAKIRNVNVDEAILAVDLEDGRTISIPTEWFPRLSHGTQSERENWEIAGAGYGIFWPDLDEDIGVEGLLAGSRSGEGPTSFARWLEKRKSLTNAETTAPQLQLREEQATYTTAEYATPVVSRRVRGFSLSEYLDAALGLAEYERGDTGSIFAIVPDKKGFFSQGDTFEEARENLRDAIEGNVLLSLQLGISIPEIDGIEIHEWTLNAAA